MKNKTKIKIGIVILLILLFTGITLIRMSHSKTEVIKCISEKAILYSQSNNAFCIQQEEVFKKKVKLLNGVDCSVYYGVCSDAGVKVLPTWILNNGTQLIGFYQIKELQEIMGC